MKSGNYLSSRAVRPSTLGVRELNFCVRDGNRWILSAIVTGMVYKALSRVISMLSLKVSPFNDCGFAANNTSLRETDNYTARIVCSGTLANDPLKS